jgi:hypothetical protein
MLFFLLGVGALVLYLWGGRAFVNANPARIAQQLRLSGGILALIAGVVLTLTGRAGFGVPLAMLGFSALTRLGRTRRATQRTPGASSNARSAMLEMALDIDSGEMQGRVLAGRFAGRDLEGLTSGELLMLMGDVSQADRDGAALLEAYLDRRMPSWREDLQGDAGAGRHHAAGQGPMTEQEAYEVLGLDPGAAAPEIRRAHRELMKKLHPDQGGSNYLASRVNQAKDVLTRAQR